MEEQKIILRGVSLTKESIDEKYDVELTELEWKIFASNLSKSWNNDQEGLRKLAFNHIKIAMEQMGYKLGMKDNKIAFIKKE